MCKVPGAEVSLVCLSRSKEASVAEPRQGWLVGQGLEAVVRPLAFALGVLGAT